MTSWEYLSHGRTADVYISADHTQVKKVYHPESLQYYQLEVQLLQKLKGKPHVPQFIKTERMQHTIYMTYCGERINKTNLPPDWESQLQNIFTIFDNINIIHDDFNIENFTVLDSTLYQIDFGRCLDKRRYNFLRNYYYQRKKEIIKKLLDHTPIIQKRRPIQPFKRYPR